MMLNQSQIKALGLIKEGFEERSLRPAGYDLRIQRITSHDKDNRLKHDELQAPILPQGIVNVVSQEVLSLPKDICAYASVKTSVCREGVLAINIGIIDPGWQGPVSSLLLNFGSHPAMLRFGDPFLRLTFHQVFYDQAADFKPSAKERNSYQAEVDKLFFERMASTFMNFDEAFKKAAETTKDQLLKYVAAAAFALAVMTFWLNFGTMSLASRAMPQDEVLLRAKDLLDKDRREFDKERREMLDQNRRLSDRINALEAGRQNKK